MDKKTTDNRIRYYWVDNMKLFACVLVVVFHFIPSLGAIFAIPRSVDIVKSAVYTFHVPLFFVCSGFLYQKSNKVHSFKSWGDNVISKLIALGVPYFTFSFITILIKILFKDDVNTVAPENILYSLFAYPSAPYWYLYALFLLFLVTPCMKTKKQAVILFAVSAAARIFYTVNLDYLHIQLPYIIDSIICRLIWFAFGMLIAFDVIDFKKLYMKILMPVVFAAACILSIVFYKDGDSTEVVKLVLGAMFVLFFVFIFINIRIEKADKLSERLSPLFMPIFVMHTIFAAGCRILLVKLGITSALIHIPLGVFVAFALPSIYYLIAKKLKLFMFFIYPKKVLKNKETV